MRHPGLREFSFREEDDGYSRTWGLGGAGGAGGCHSPVHVLTVITNSR